MATLNFPTTDPNVPGSTSPSDGQTHTTGGESYVYSAGTATTPGVWNIQAVAPIQIDSSTTGHTGHFVDTGDVEFSINSSGDIEADINDGHVTRDKIADAAVNAAKIETNAVTTDKINANAVTSAKLASSTTVDTDRAVTTDHIRDGAVTLDKLGGDFYDSYSLSTGEGYNVGDNRLSAYRGDTLYQGTRIGFTTVSFGSTSLSTNADAELTLPRSSFDSVSVGDIYYFSTTNANILQVDLDRFRDRFGLLATPAVYTAEIVAVDTNSVRVTNVFLDGATSALTLLANGANTNSNNLHVVALETAPQSTTDPQLLFRVLDVNDPDNLLRFDFVNFEGASGITIDRGFSSTDNHMRFSLTDTAGNDLQDAVLYGAGATVASVLDDKQAYRLLSTYDGTSDPSSQLPALRFDDPTDPANDVVLVHGDQLMIINQHATRNWEITMPTGFTINGGSSSVSIAPNHVAVFTYTDDGADTPGSRDWTSRVVRATPGSANVDLITNGGLRENSAGELGIDYATLHTSVVVSGRVGDTLTTGLPTGATSAIEYEWPSSSTVGSTLSATHHRVFYSDREELVGSDVTGTTLYTKLL